MILLTGATGFLGGALAEALAARNLLADTLFLVRAATPAAGLARLREALQAFDISAQTLAALSEAQILAGDLCDLADVPELASDARLDAVTEVINCAALATFANNPRIRQVNVLNTFRFAQALAGRPALRRFLHVGTAMACGPGLAPPIAESWAHMVPYTASKLEIELLLRAQLPGLPLVVARPSIVVGHTRLGCRPSGSIFWVFRMAAALEALTCDLDESVDVVPADWCAEALLTLALKPCLAHDLYHVSAGPASSDSFRAIDVAMAAADERPPVAERFRRIAVDEVGTLAPLFPQRLGEVNPRLTLRALKLYGAFAEMNYVFDNRRLLAEGVPPSPRLSDYVGACVRSSRETPIAVQMAFDFK